MDKRSTYEELEKQVNALQIEIGEIRKAKQEIEQSEAFHRLTVENISDTIIITDDHGKIIYVCPNSKIIFGLSQKQIYAKGTVQNLINGNACDLLELRKVKEISNIDWNVVDSSGRERSVLITVKSVLINGGTALYVIHDITEVKKADENLRKYKNIISSTPDAIALLDESYKYILVNNSYEKFTGVSRENFIGKTVPEYLGQEIFVKFIKPNIDRCLKGEIVNYQEWFEYPKIGRRFVDVTYFPYYDTGNSICGIIANTRDITDQKEIEETCRQLQKVSARTERIAHIGSWEWELATDTVTWSEELFRIFGLNPDGEAPNWENHQKLYHPEDFEKLHQAAETAIADGQPYELELRAFRKDGEIRICKAKAFPERGRDGQVIRLYGLVQDITDNKGAVKLLRNNELFLKSLLNAIPIPVFYKDTDGRYLGFNKSFKDYFGKHDNEIIGKTMFDLNPIDLADTYFAMDKELFKTGEKQEYESQVQNDLRGRRDVIFNKAVFHDPEGNIGGIIGTIQDITERKQAEAALRDSEEQFRHFFEHLTIGVAVYEAVEDGKDFLLIDMNPAGQELSKISIDEIRGERLTKVFPGVRDLGLFAALQNTWRTGQPAHIPLSQYKDENITRWVENRVFRLPSGKVVAIYDDRTELMRLENQLQQTQKMESIGILAGGIAHDFNNILTSIIGFTELALDEASKGTTLEDSLQEVYSAGKRAKDLVKQILAFARQSEEKLSPVKPSVVAKEILKFIRSTIPTTIKIQQDIESDALIMGNATQVHQVLMNLCTNAAYAMDDSGGVLSVSLKDVVLDKGLVAGMRPGDYVEIKVSDTGVGITPESIDKIFEPYFTTKGPGEGTGMGLAMVQGVVESYGGKITVDSQLEKGTTFTIYLPSTKKRSDQMAYVPEELPTGTERILFVDDEAPIAKMGGQILERLGYSVTTRTSSVEALELFRSKPNDFDLVLTDMTMPNLTGDKLAVELMKIRRDIAVILCTGYSKKISDETASEIGIKAFAYKPVVKADLAKTIRKVLDEAKG